MLGTVHKKHVTKPGAGLRYAAPSLLASNSLRNDTLLSVLFDIGCPRRAGLAILLPCMQEGVRSR